MKQKTKKGFLTALASAFEKDPLTSIRMYANELNVREKTVETEIKQDLNPLDYTAWGVLENRTNVTSHWFT